MKKKLVTKLLSAALAVSIAFSQGTISYAAATANDNLTELGSGSEEGDGDDSASTGAGTGSSSEGDDQSGNTGSGTGSEGGSGSGAYSESPSEASSEASTGDSTDESGEGESSEETDASDEASTESTEETEEADAEGIEKTESELPEGINGMPEDYKLSSTQKKMKEKVREHDVLDKLDDLDEGVDYVSKEVIALADSRDEAEAIANAYSGKLIGYGYGVATISLSDSSLSVEEALEYALDEELELPLVEPNYISYIDPVIEPTYQGVQSSINSNEVPSGNGFSDWWGEIYSDPWLNQDNLYNGEGYQWHHKMINTYSAWGVTTGSRDVTVAVLDTGVNTAHSELDSSFSTYHVEEVQVEDGYDYNVESGGEDTVGHGTHVAGIIASKLNGNLGAGVAPGVNIVAVKVNKADDTRGAIPDDYVIAALNFISGYVDGDRKADIINLSVGNPAYNAAYDEAIRHTYENGVTIVASMGNNSANQKNYPASFDHVIGVCSLNEAGALSHFSNFGPWADISAPGSNIWSASKNDTDAYVCMGGTSMATPIVAGACALYMSAYGYVDPDTMTRVIKSSVTGSAGSGSGAGILDLAKMFGGDTTSPMITMAASDNTEIAAVQDGKTFTVPYGVAGNSVISFTAMNFDGNLEANEHTKIVYTTNGSMPSVSNGSVVNGTVYDGNGITVSSILSAGVSGSKITVKAIAVTGMGVVSKPATMIFNYDPSITVKDSSLKEYDIEITAPATLVAGKSVKLEAKVTSVSNPKEAVPQNVTWKIEGYSDGDMAKAKINATNGTLSTDKNQEGTLYVSCTTADSRATETVYIRVMKAALVKELSIAAEKSTLGFTYDDDSAVGESTVVSVSKLKDTAGLDLLADENFAKNDKTFQWLTSNAKVVKIEQRDEKSATITAVSAGTADITCKVLDGSGKSAKIKIKVASDKKVASMSIVSALDPTLTLTLIHKRVGEEAHPVQVKMTNSDGTTCTVAPLWTSSNTKVAVVEGDGKNAQIKPVSRGTAVITAAAQDGSGKKASVKVEVFQLVQSIQVKGQKYIAEGATASFSATVLPANANNNKVSWSLENNPDPENITIAANGKVTVKKGAAYNESTEITVKATATDVKDDEEPPVGIAKFKVMPKATKVALALAEGDYSATIATKAKGRNKTQTKLVAVADNGTDLAFTSSNVKVATVTNEGNVATVTAVGKGTAVITAAAQDGSGKKATYKINVIQLVDRINVTGQASVVAGSKAQFKAEVLPKTANNKNIEWSLMTEDPDNAGRYIELTAESGITIDKKKGTVVVSKDCQRDTKVLVLANSLDGGEAEISAAKFSVTDVKTSGVSVTVANSLVGDPVRIPAFNKAGVLTSVRLYDTDIPKVGSTDDDEREITINASTNSGAALKWTTSNASVAKIVDFGDGRLQVTGLNPGTANLTCAALDGSGKKTTVKLTVIKPASGIEVVEAKGLTNNSVGGASYLAMGKSATSSAVLGNAFGKPTINKVNWSWEVGFFDSSTGNTYMSSSSSVLEPYKQKKYFGSASGAKVNAGSEKNLADSYYSLLGQCVRAHGLAWKSNTYLPFISLKAETTDGTGYSREIAYFLVPPTKTLMLIGGYNYRTGKSVALPPRTHSASEIGKALGYTLSFNDDSLGAFNVTSSNPNVATGFVSGDMFYYFLYGKGTTTLKITAMDGTNKSTTLKVTVK